VGHETILLTEDQAEVRAITRSILERYGYRVLEARTGEDALEVAARFEGRLDLLLTDIVMPNMNGRELARRLGELRPGVKVLYMSGYTDVAAIQQALLDPGTAYIQKPLAHEALAKRVRQVLEGGA
jgi:CheY-like chemotaxis protein